MEEWSGENNARIWREVMTWVKKRLQHMARWEHRPVCRDGAGRLLVLWDLDDWAKVRTAHVKGEGWNVVRTLAGTGAVGIDEYPPQLAHERELFLEAMFKLAYVAGQRSAGGPQS